MKKIKKASELLWLLGIFSLAFGVALCGKANLGVSMIAAPSFIISEALSAFWSVFSVGVTEYVLQGVILIILCLVVRSFNWRYLLTFAVAVLYGYCLNFFLWLLGGLSPAFLWERWLMLLLGDLLVGFGVACFFRTYLPLQVHELFVSEFSSKFEISISKVKPVFDVTLLVISLVLAFTLFGDVRSFDWSKITHEAYHSIGLGTLVTTAINSPIIKLMGKLLDRFFESTPRFDKLNKFLSLK